MVLVSAPGKIHLIGEHAVVYGEPAIIASVGLRLRVKFEKHDKVRYVDERWDSSNIQEWSLEDVKETTQHVKELWEFGSKNKDFTPLFNMVKADRYASYRKAAVGLVLEKLGISQGVSLRISSDVPAGAGVGSSSALAVCLVLGIAELNGIGLSKEKTNSIAFEIEKLIHGTPSGGDNTACCYGGLVWFQKGQSQNVTISLKDEIKDMPKGFVLLGTMAQKASTGELVQHVRNLDEAHRKPRIQEIGQLAYEMKTVLKNKNYSRMKEIINRDQQLLAELGVSTGEIDGIAVAVRNIGGAAKLCGAGGGGVMLCWHDDVALLKKTIFVLGYEPREVELGIEGVRIENE